MMLSVQPIVEEEEKNPLVSIIVPVYNVAPYLPDCLNSLVNQTYTNIEIILVNDGSTDESGTICDDYARQDPRIKVIHKENGGPSQTRNVGLDLSKGAYITFVDSDDWLTEDAIEQLMLKFETYPNLDVIRFAFYAISASGNKYLMRSLPYGDTIFSKEQAFRLWMRAEAWHGVCAIYRSSVIEGIRFKEGAFSEDLEFTMKLFLHKEFTTLFFKDPLYYYRFNETGTTQSRSVVMWRDACSHWIDAIEQTERTQPKIATQIAYGLFVQLRQEEIVNTRSQPDPATLQALQTVFAPAFDKLKRTSIDWSLSTQPIKDKIFLYFPRLFRLLRPKFWGVESIRKL